MSLSQSQPGCSAAARSKYHCDVCDLPVISYDLKNHYLSKTDWEKLEKLRKCDGDGTQINVEDLDDHTKYMLKWKHTKNNLPSYKNHRREKTIKVGPIDNLFRFQGRKSKDLAAESRSLLQEVPEEEGGEGSG